MDIDPAFPNFRGQSFNMNNGRVDHSIRFTGQHNSSPTKRQPFGEVASDQRQHGHEHAINSPH